MSALAELIARVEGLKGPDREVDAHVAVAIYGGARIDDGGKYPGWWFTDLTEHLKAPRYTASIDAVVALIERELPGWWWKCGTCCVSDDACIAPDFNSPKHGERLKAQFFPLVPGSELDAGFDVDRRPPGNVAIALLEAFLRALEASRGGER